MSTAWRHLVHSKQNLADIICGHVLCNLHQTGSPCVAQFQRYGFLKFGFWSFWANFESVLKFTHMPLASYFCVSLVLI